MSESSIEQRLTAAETAVSELQHRIANVPSSPNWLEQVTDALKDGPAFEDVMAYGKAQEEADQLLDSGGELAPLHAA